MPPFLESLLHWAQLTVGHFLFMFWLIWVLAILATALSESFWADCVRRRLLERHDDGWRTVGRAVLLGLLSPPSRRRIFRQTQELLAGGVSRAAVLAYLVSGQAILLWLLFIVVALNGPQPMLGQLVAAAAALAVLLWGTGRSPDSVWRMARERARGTAGTPASPGRVSAGGATSSGSADPSAAVREGPSPIVRTGPVPLRLLKSVGGQALSLWWPLLFGTLGVGFFLALGQSPGYLSLQGAKGPLVQGGNAVVGLLVAYVTGAPLVGNALFAAGLWKAQFVTYAGLSAFYLGTLVMPFVIPRYFTLFGVELGKRVLWWLVAAILVGALTAAAWWWGLDGLAGLVGAREWFETPHGLDAQAQRRPLVPPLVRPGTLMPAEPGVTQGASGPIGWV